MINLNRRFFLQGMSLSLLSIGASVSAKENRDLFSTISINKEDVLLVIDVQNDFCPGGSLEVKDGDTIIEGINTVQKSFKNIIF